VRNRLTICHGTRRPGGHRSEFAEQRGSDVVNLANDVVAMAHRPAASAIWTCTNVVRGTGIEVDFPVPLGPVSDQRGKSLSWRHAEQYRVSQGEASGT
jgi:hypothetical protein